MRSRVLILLLWLFGAARTMAQDAAPVGGTPAPEEGAEASGSAAEPASEPAGPSEAAPAEQASRAYEDLVRDAIAAQESGDYASAHALFAEAHAQRPNARTLRGMGVASFQAGRFTQAVAELDAALAHPERPLEGELRAATEELLARARKQLGVVTLDVSPAGARVHVDGAQESLDASEPLALEPGAHTLRLQAEGHVEQEIGIDVAAGTREMLRVRLREIGAPAPTSGPVVVMRPPLDPETPREAASLKAERTHRRRRIGMWSTLGLAGAAGITAGALFTTATLRIDDVGDACRKLSSGTCTEAQKQAALDDANIDTFELAINVTGAIAVASLATSGALWYWDRRTTQRRVDVRFSARSLVVSGSF